ncbi:hypothetical protein AB0J90_15210 [Micromonospora sp. NPDC049523]|uniref:hypothetical protein n=1 Tax=Micromonospora sp. NPDC049523 TaxID=3155921 RepID=UPI00342F099E
MGEHPAILMSELRKITVNLTPRAVGALDYLGDINPSKTDAVNWALVLAAKLAEIAPVGDFVILLPDGSRHRFVQLS